MARGDCENAFQAAAAADGIVLVRARVPWINQRGHLGLPEQAAPVLPVLDEIFKTLGGIEPEQAAKKATVLPGDFLHVESGVLIETDEEQHFTSHRLVTSASTQTTCLSDSTSMGTSVCARRGPTRQIAIGLASPPSGSARAAASVSVPSTTHSAIS